MSIVITTLFICYQLSSINVLHLYLTLLVDWSLKKYWGCFIIMIKGRNNIDTFII